MVYEDEGDDGWRGARRTEYQGDKNEQGENSMNRQGERGGEGLKYRRIMWSR